VPLLRVHEGVLRDALDLLRSHSAEGTECVVVWIGPRSSPSWVDEVAHPRHTATSISYQIDSAWITERWDELAETRRAIKAQLHTHPDAAFHSPTDDQYPIVHTPGFLSIVLAHSGQVGFTDARAYRIGAGGAWIALPITEAFEVAA
jgi:hypothetical protein